MSRILLINVDSKILNLALMKISAYHKNKGDIVGFDITNPDIVYISCVFTQNAEKARGIATYYPDSEIVFGGSGIDISKKLPDDIEYLCPDYSIYPNCDYSMGYTTRGCIRSCPFCIVPKKEGFFKRWQHIREFHNPQHRKVMVLDNNVYADRTWFFENTNYIIENNLQFNAVQGMDIRLLDEEIADRLKQIRWFGTMHFAFDNIKDEEKVLRGIEILQNAGFDTSHISFYVLTGYNTTFEEDLYRINLLRSHNCGAFVMQYKKTSQSKQLARYVNRRWLYWSTTFEEYSPLRENQLKRVRAQLPEITLDTFSNIY